MHFLSLQIDAFLVAAKILTFAFFRGLGGAIMLRTFRLCMMTCVEFYTFHL